MITPFPIIINSNFMIICVTRVDSFQLEDVSQIERHVINVSMIETFCFTYELSLYRLHIRN